MFLSQLLANILIKHRIIEADLRGSYDNILIRLVLLLLSDFGKLAETVVLYIFKSDKIFILGRVGMSVKISVIMPVYNASEYLGETLDSLVN